MDEPTRGSEAGQAPALHPNAERVAAHARSAGYPIEVAEYPEGTRTAGDAAAAVGCLVDQIVKSMVFEADDGLILALTSGVHRVDPDALARCLGVNRCARPDADRVRKATGFPIGGVPPFGHSTPLDTVVDPHLCEFDVVWAAAGTPRHVFPIDPAHLIEISGGTIADFTAT